VGPDPFVTIEGLGKRFGGLVAVEGVSLRVAEGHTLALLGPSGCGKTTILRCLAGLETPDEGRIAIGGRPVFDRQSRIDLPPEARALGIVFQSYAVWPHMTVGENVAFPLKVRRIPREEQRARVARILDIVGLSQWQDKPATQLSGGQQQRVALARALVHEPRLVLFDEPMSNLDAQLRDQVRVELQLLQKRLGFTAIYVTHDQAEAFALAERIVVMNRGRIEAEGSPREVFGRPATGFVARFLGFNVHRGTVPALGPAGSIQVSLADGLALWGMQAGTQLSAPGDAVLFCTRKQHVAVRPRGAGAGSAAVAGTQTFGGVIRAVSFLGLEEEYVVAANGLEWRSVQTPQGLHTGEAVEVSVAPADGLVFAADGRMDA
jgi:iron(III) transport system ATP-binding protein